MKTFKEFTSENWMYHGTNKKVEGPLQRNYKSHGFSDSLGVHYAADHNVSHVFATGHRTKESPLKGRPTIFRTRRPPRSKLVTIDQKHDEWDADAISRHVIKTVLSHPDHKHHFINWHHNKLGTSRQHAENTYNRLRAGNPVSDKWGETHTSIPSYLHMNMAHKANWGYGEKEEIVNDYHKIMKKRGIHGLVYRNTDNIETDHIHAGERGSTKTYIMFPHGKKL